MADKVPADLRNRLGIAMASRTYKAYRELLGTPRWQRVYNAGARPQRLLWASTGTKDPKASDILYIKSLAAPFTVNTMPEATLKALADHGEIGRSWPPMAGTVKKSWRNSAGRGKYGCLAAQLAGRRREVIREVVERPAGGDRFQERRAASRLGARLKTRFLVGADVTSLNFLRF